MTVATPMFRVLCIAALATAPGATACGHARAAEEPGAPAPRRNDPNVLERDEIPHNASSMVDVLQGRFPGVTIERKARSISVVIRGIGSINSSNEALIIVDGMDSPPHVLMEMNPRDVERVEVVKDGAAARFGSRGANGALLITTRRGDS